MSHEPYRPPGSSGVLCRNQPVHLRVTAISSIRSTCCSSAAAAMTSRSGTQVCKLHLAESMEFTQAFYGNLARPSHCLDDLGYSHLRQEKGPSGWAHLLHASAYKNHVTVLMEWFETGVRRGSVSGADPSCTACAGGLARPLPENSVVHVVALDLQGLLHRVRVLQPSSNTRDRR